MAGNNNGNQTDQTLANKIAVNIAGKAAANPNPALISAADLAEILNALNVKVSQVTPPTNPEGVSWKSAPDVDITGNKIEPTDGIFLNQGVEETVVAPADGFTLPAVTAGNQQPYTLTADYTAQPPVYIPVAGPVSALGSSFTYPPLPANRLFVANFMVTELGVAKVPTGAVKSVLYPDGTEAFPNANGQVQLPLPVPRYSNTFAAMDAIPQSQRYVGLTVSISNSSLAQSGSFYDYVDYWFQGGITDAHLKPKFPGVITVSLTDIPAMVIGKKIIPGAWYVALAPDNKFIFFLGMWSWGFHALGMAKTYGSGAAAENSSQLLSISLHPTTRELVWTDFVATGEGGGGEGGSSTGTAERTWQVGQGTAGNKSTFEAVGTENDIAAAIKPKGNAYAKLEGMNYVTSGNRMLLLNSLGQIITGSDPADFLTASVLGHIVYVSPSGNDSTGLRGRIDKPYKTLQGAIDSPFIQDYDVVYVMPGVYPAGVNTHGAREWNGAKNITFILENCEVIGDFGSSSPENGDFSIVGLGFTKITGAVGVGHGGHKIKDIFNVEITNGINRTVSGKVRNSKITFSNTELALISGTWEDCEIYSPNRLFAPFVTPLDNVVFKRCQITVAHFGEQFSQSGHKLIFENCSIKLTDDTKPGFTHMQAGFSFCARNSTFEFGQHFYQARADNAYEGAENFYLQNCIFYSRAGSILIKKTENPNRVASRLEVVNTVSNIPLGETADILANFIQASITNF